MDGWTDGSRRTRSIRERVRTWEHLLPIVPIVRPPPILRARTSLEKLGRVGVQESEGGRKSCEKGGKGVEREGGGSG